MIKKIFGLLFVFVTVMNACLCEPEISMGFNQISTKVQTILQKDIAIIDKELIKALKQNTADIKEQNAILTQILNGLKIENEQKTEIVFLLTKLKNIQ